MEDFTPINEYLKANPSYEPRKKSPIGGICLVAGGIALLVLSVEMPLRDTPQMVLFTLGCLTAIAGAIALFVAAFSDSGRYRFKPTGVLLRRYERYINNADRMLCHEILRKGSFEQLKSLRTENSTGIRLRIYLSDDHTSALVQLEECSPYQFAATTPVVSVDGDDARYIAALIGR